MIFKNITIVNEEFKIEENRDVLVSEVTGNIEEIAKTGEIKQSLEGHSVYGGKDKVLLPGFVNSHGHSPMTLLRGYGENLALEDWLFKKIFPFEAKLTGDAVYWGTILAMAESIKYGITSTTDMYYFCDDMIEAVVDAKCKNNISRGITNFEKIPFEKLESYTESKELFKRYNKYASGKIKVDMCIHGEYTSDSQTVKGVADAAKELGARIHIHMSETEKEHLECIERHRKTPAEYFHELGLFDMPTTAAHCVWVTEGDMDIMRAREVTVAANPMSNLKLASGVSNVTRFLEKGINVAIGTDSVASNNSLNFIEEMKIFALAPKMYYNNPAAISPKETLYCGTRGGAIGQGRSETGIIKEGYKADLCIIDIDKPHMIPCHDLITNLVYSSSGSDVVLTMVDGNVLYEDGEFKAIDIEKIKHNANRCKDEILKQL